MTRQEQIKQAACQDLLYRDSVVAIDRFIAGAEWADQHQPSPWISVEDRLPKEGDLVLAMSETTNTDGIFRGFSACKYTDGKFLHENHYSFSDNNGVFYKFNNEMIVFNVTHWMPIPPIQKGGEK